MSGRTIDNDRGERRAEELRRRFQNVSNASFGRRRSGGSVRSSAQANRNGHHSTASGQAVKFMFLIAVAVMLAGLFF